MGSHPWRALWLSRDHDEAVLVPLRSNHLDGTSKGLPGQGLAAGRARVVDVGKAVSSAWDPREADAE